VRLSYHGEPPLSASPQAVVTLGKRPQVILGVPVAPVTMAEVVEVCRRAIVTHERVSIGVVNAAKVVKMKDDPALRAAVLSSDIIVADGMSIVWAGRVLGSPLPERVAGVDLLQELLEVADRERFSVYLLGGRQEVVQEVARRVSARHSALRIAGIRHGYFTEAEEPAVVEAINAARPDLLFIGISTPKKELFTARWRSHLDVAVCHGVGGSFDVIAGQVRRAPSRFQALGLEWFYRLLQEPRRMWKRYLVTNTRFMCMLVAAWARRQTARSIPAGRRRGEQP
jgi:N-acetylglucosaminyldiphosphoundecaprenol N-acetyl-beta-D-mannosaminyltransferase